MIAIPGVSARERRRTGRIRSMKLRNVKRKYEVPFEECRRIIQLFINGISIENMVGLTGLQKSRVVEILLVTRELLLRGHEVGGRSLVPR
jgi:hypothetical protein